MKQRRTPSQRDILMRFVLRFTLSCVVLYTFFNWIPSSLVKHLNRYTAATLGSLLRLAGFKPHVDGELVEAGGFCVKIIPECSAIFVVILFFSFVFAYPTSLRHKTTGVLLGVPALFAVNLFRLLAVILTGMKQPDFFEYVHVYLGQIMMVFFLISVSMIWLRSVVMVRTKDSPFIFFIRFVAFSTIPFWLWLYLHECYVLMHFHAIKLLLGLFDYKMAIPGKISMYPLAFDTFNLVTFTGLVLATNSIARARKIKGLIAGFAMLSLTHFAFRLSKSLFLDFDVEGVFMPFISLIIINEWVLPFVLWLAIVGKEIFKRKGIYTCPFCGEEKVGIIQHIMAKHGEHALKDKRVKPLLEEFGLIKDKASDHRHRIRSLACE